jgi:hypothetical protein
VISLGVVPALGILQRAEIRQILVEGLPTLGGEVLLAALGVGQDVGRGLDQVVAQVGQLAPLDAGAQLGQL